MYSIRSAGRTGLLLIALAMPLCGVHAQDSGGVGTVRGVVQTAEGKPVGGFWLMIVNADLGMNYRKDVNPIGQFEFTGVYPGTYVFKISPYSYVVRDPAQIVVQANRTMDIKVIVVRAPAQGGTGRLQPSRERVRMVTVAQNVTTSQNQQPERNGQTPPSTQANGATRSEATAAVSAASGTQISEAQLVGLPLNGRSYSQLATLQSGVADPLGGSAQRGGGSGSLTVSGGRASSNTFLMDGTNIMDTGNQVPRSAAGVQLGTDSIMEVQVNGVQYSAEYGRGSGGVLNSITRSGTDELRVSLFEFFRNSHLDARNFFDRKRNPDDPRLPPFKRNQFGFTTTAPLVSKTTYVMGGMEVMRDRLSLTDTSNVVDKTHVSDALPPCDGRATVSGVPPCVVEPSVQALLAYYAPANDSYIGGGFGRNSTAVFLPTNEIFFTTRVDHKLTDRTSLFGRYIFDDANSYSAQTLPQLFRTINESRQQYATLVASRIVSPQIIITGRTGYTRPVSTRHTVAGLEIPRELFFVSSAPDFGQVAIPGSSSFGPTPTLPESEVMNSFQFAGDVILQRGPHNLKMGAEAHRYRWDVFTSANQGALWNFTSLANYLTLERDLPAGSKGTTSLTLALPGSDGSKAYRQSLFGFYLQDEYRVLPRLQLSLGLRYEFTTLIHDREGRTAHLADPWRDAAMQAGPLLKDNPSLRNFSPRVGLTWAPTGSANTIFSAGLGIYYDQIIEYAVDSRSLSPPFYRSVFIPNLKPKGTFPNAVAAAAAETGSPVQALIMDYADMKTPSVIRFNTSLRQQLPDGTRLQLAYVGARGNHLYRAYEINQFPLPVVRDDGTYFFPPNGGPINPSFGSINLLASDAQSFYHALQISANRTLGRGASVQANYTYSKSVDDSSNFNTNNEGIQYGLLRNVDRAISDYDIRNRLTGSFFFNVPFGGQGLWWKSGALSHVFGGWRLGGILSARNGVPINLRISVRDENFLFAARRPNLRPGRDSNPIHGVTQGCDGVAPGITLGTPDFYYDPCAFSVPAAGTIGNNGRNTMKGPGSFTVDVSLQREFLLDSKRRLQFRGEAFNLTNHPNFRPFVAGSGVVFQGSASNPRVNPTSGRIVNTVTTARQIQFALRLSF